ncbi:MAG: type II toxin-antitoxin system VapC family toxin [Polyangia bacterium]|jgi:predicted nucleic acid-binding protein|nr:type II toxin-antitoxin system VapC family toxin [Polyangia bacterium]
MASDRSYVLDASVGIKLLVAETGSDKVDSIFDAFAQNLDTRLYVPTLFFVECANVLWKIARRGQRKVEDIPEDIESLIGLALDRLDILPLMPDAMRLALEHDISVYDATYAAAARACGVPLLTADERLAKRLAGSDVEVVTLGSL